VGWRLRKGGRDISASVKAAPSTPVIAGFGGLTVIGHGSTATVFRARQDGFDREVAIKVLNVDISDRRAQKRFQRERSLNGRLSDHPNVVTVLDSGFVDGRYPYLAMEFFEQGSLADQLRANGPFEVPRTLHIGVRIAGALETAHRIGVLHRDVKPHNILMSRFGEPALADFGIAAILEMEQSMTAALTPIHAAPELLEGADPTPQSDVYAFGSTLYTLLAGAPPFGGPPGEGMLSQLLRIATTEVPTLTRPDMPAGLAELLRDCMAKRPEDRVRSAEEMGQRLRDLQRGLHVQVSTLPVETLGEMASNASVVETWQAMPIEPPKDEKFVAPLPIEFEPVAESAVWSKPDARFARDALFENDPLPLPVDLDPAGGTITFTQRPTPLPPSVGVNARPLVPLHPAVRSVPSPPVAPLRVTPSRDDRDFTVSARQLHPVTPTPDRQRSKWPWLAAIGGVVVGAAGVAVVTVGLRPDTTNTPTTTPTTVTSTTALNGSTAPTTTIDYSQFAPTRVNVDAVGDRVHVRFTDQTNGARQHLLRLARSPGKVIVDPVITRAGESFVILPSEIKSSEPLCVSVSAIIDLANKRFAETKPVCINGAQPIP
jgi:serine/threonine-protein kinase PknK